MKNRLLKFVVFGIMLIVSDQLVGWAISYFAKKQIRDNRIGLVADNKINAQIFVIGSSRALNNYDPEIISAKTGKTCYNLGVSGSNIPFHEFLIKLLAIHHKKPEMIIYNIDDYGTLYSNDLIIFRKDLLYPFVDNEMINKEVAEQLDKPLIANYLSSTYRQNMNFFKAAGFPFYGREIVDYATTNFDEHGANLLVNESHHPYPAFISKGYDVSKLTIDSDYVRAYQSIQKICRENGIALVLVVPPIFMKNTEGFMDMIQKFTSPEFSLLDYRGSLNDSLYFYNADHMNRKGATYLSEKLGDDLKTKK